MLSALFLWSTEGVADDAGRRKVRVAITGRSIAYYPIIAAQVYGFYRVEGLDVENVVMMPTLSLQALIGGDIDFVTVPSLVTVAAIAGMPVRHIMALNSGPIHSLVVNPVIRKLDNLKGKTVGVAAFKDVTDVGIRRALNAHGLIPDSDVRIIVAGSSNVRYVALQTGKLDGTLLSAPQNKMALKMGFGELLYLKDYLKVPSAGLSTTVTKLRTEPEMVVRFIRGTLKGTQFLQDNRPEFLKLLSRESKIQDTEIGGLIHKEFVELISKTGIPSPASMEEVISNAKEAQGVVNKHVLPTEVADFSFARMALSQIKPTK
jgi:ABC-type nitrate/sulfonate/bicarbonate transport system substrate-binding protein